ALAMQGGTDAVSQMISPLPPPFGTPVTMNVDRLRKVADSLMAASQSRAIENLLQVWPQVDPSAAVTWLLEQGASMDPRHVRRLAAGFARGELPLSSEFPNTLPPESRGAWIAEVAGVYAATDLDAALTWLGRFEGEPGYDGWAASAAASVIASPVGATSPAAAAAILGTAQQPPLDVTARVASRWASREDPRGALEWA